MCLLQMSLKFFVKDKNVPMIGGGLSADYDTIFIQQKSV